MDPGKELCALLDAALGRERRLLLLRSLLAATAVALVLAGLGLLALGRGWLPPESRLFLASLVLASTAVAARLAWRSTRRGGRLAARILRDRQPVLHAGVSGAEALARDGPGAGCSEALARAHVAEVLERVRPLGAPGLAPTRLLRPGLAAWGVALPCLLILVVALRPALVKGAALAVAPSTDADRPTIADRPLVGDVDLVFHFPVHLERESREIDATTGEIDAPNGTRVWLRTHALQPIAEAAIAMERGGRLALARDGRTLSGELLVVRDDRYAFQVRLPDGRTLREARWRTIRVERDAAPFVEILDPSDDVVLGPEETLQGRYRASDDVAVTEVALVVRVQGRDEERRKLALPSTRVDELSGPFEVRLGDLGLRGGEALSVTVEALDNDTVSGPNVGVSEARVVRVASPMSRHRAVIEEQARLLDVLVGVLGDRLERSVPDSGSVRDVRSRFERIRAGTEEALQLLAIVEEGLAEDGLSRLDVGSALRGIRGRLSALLRREVGLHGEPPADASRRTEVDRLAVAELERDVLLVEDLLGRQRIESLERLGEEVNMARHRLAQLLERYGQSRGEGVRRELLAEIARLESSVAALYERLAELERRVPGEFLNAEALRQVDLLSDLRALRESLAAGDVRAAEEALSSLEGRMRELMAALEGSSARFSGERFADAERARQELLAEVMDVEAEQRALSKRTEIVQERFRRRLAEEMQGRIDPLVRRLVELTDASLRALDGTEPESVPGIAAEDLARARERVLDLRALLEQGDLDEARGMADAAVEGLRSTEIGLEFFAEGSHSSSAVARTRRAVARARPPVEEVAEALEESIPDVAMLLGESDRRALQGQSHEQRSLAERVRGLQGEMQRPDAPLPFLSDDASMLLGGAESHMREAGDRLAGSDPRGALLEQDAALDVLRRLRDAAESSSRLVGRGSTFRQRVRIPSPEEHRGPEDLRRRILEALREEPPAPYALEVRRYLEELAR